MQTDLTNGSVLKNIALFSLPFFLSYFLQTLYGLADLFRFFPKNGGIHFYHNVQAFNVDSRSTLKA